MATQSPFAPRGLNSLSGYRVGSADHDRVCRRTPRANQATSCSCVHHRDRGPFRKHRRKTAHHAVDITWGTVLHRRWWNHRRTGVAWERRLAFSSASRGTRLDMVGDGDRSTGFVSAYVNTREMAPMIADRSSRQSGLPDDADDRSQEESRGIGRVGRPRAFSRSRSWSHLRHLWDDHDRTRTSCTMGVSYLSCALAGQRGLHGTVVRHLTRPTTRCSPAVRRDLSVIKALIFVTLIIAIHGIQGLYARGGPEGSGRPRGEPIRAST